MGSGQDNEDALLGARAVEMGLITATQLKDALHEQSRLAREEGESPSLGYVLVSQKLIPEQQLVSLLWDEELEHSDQEIRDFLDSFDDAPKKKESGPPTQRVVLKENSLGKYTLVREAGRGGMAVVYEALDGDH